MRKDLLAKMADLLGANAANPRGVQFNLGVWAVTKNENGERISVKPFTSIDCGTTACAMGLAALRGTFEGLTYDFDFEVPIFDGAYGFSAASKLFEIDHDTSKYLFDAFAYEPGNRSGTLGEIAVATRIRRLIA